MEDGPADVVPIEHDRGAVDDRAGHALQPQTPLGKTDFGRRLFRILILLISLATMIAMISLAMSAQKCELALEKIGDLQMCQTCDILEQAGVIIHGRYG
jgi:hypothetical protein